MVVDESPIGDSKIRAPYFLDDPERTQETGMVGVHVVKEPQKWDMNVRFSPFSHKSAKGWKRKQNHDRSHLSAKHGKPSTGRILVRPYVVLRGCVED